MADPAELVRQNAKIEKAAKKRYEAALELQDAINKLAEAEEADRDVRKRITEEREVCVLRLTAEAQSSFEQAEAIREKAESVLGQLPNEGVDTIVDCILKLKSVAPEGCLNLQKASSEYAATLTARLKGSLFEEYKGASRAIGWPKIDVITRELLTADGNNTNVKKWKSSFQKICSAQLHLEPNLVNIVSINALSPSEQGSQVWVIQALFSALETRFKYHFLSDRQTNRIDRPEWCYSHVLQRLAEITKLSEIIQEEMKTSGIHGIDPKKEIVDCFMGLLTARIQHEIPLLISDDDTFRHSIKEAMVFDESLRLSHGIPLEYKRCVSEYLMNGDAFATWLKLEQNDAVAVMDRAVKQKNAFQLKDSGDNSASSCVSAEILHSLIVQISDKIRHMGSENNKRMQFVYIQISIFDQYLQIIKEEAARQSESIPGLICIANTCIDCSEMMKNLDNDLLYIEIKCSSLGSGKKAKIDFDVDIDVNFDVDFDVDIDVDGSDFFGECSLSYISFADCVAGWLVGNSVAQFKKAASLYLNSACRSTPNASWRNKPVLELSNEICDGLGVLRDNLHFINHSLNKNSAAIVWRGVAVEIDRLLFENVLLNIAPEKAAVLQAQYDMKAIISLFKSFENYESCFKRIHSGLALLQMSDNEAKAINVEDNEEEIALALRQLKLFGIDKAAVRRLFTIRSLMSKQKQ